MSTKKGKNNWRLMIEINANLFETDIMINWSLYLIYKSSRKYWSRQACIVHVHVYAMCL